MLLRALINNYMQRQVSEYYIYWSFSYTVDLSEAQGLSVKKKNYKHYKNYVGFGNKKKLCIALAAKLSKASNQWYYTDKYLKNKFQECYNRLFYKTHIYNTNIFYVCLCLD